MYIGAAVDVLLNYILIRKYGIIGAAYATLITEMVVFFVAPLLFKKTRNFNQLYFNCFKRLPDLIEYLKQVYHQFLNSFKKV